MSPMVRSLATALALTILTGGAAQAFPGFSRQAPPTPARLIWLDAAWEWIASRLPARLVGEPRTVPAGQKEGGMMDPDGLVVTVHSSVEFGTSLHGSLAGSGSGR
jgi:hypothetical protein